MHLYLGNCQCMIDYERQLMTLSFTYYNSSGIMGSANSRSHNLNNEAQTWGSLESTTSFPAENWSLSLSISFVFPGNLNIPSVDNPIKNEYLQYLNSNYPYY